MHCCSTKDNFNSGKTLVQVVDGKSFFVCGSSDHKYNDFLWPFEQITLKRRKKNNEHCERDLKKMSLIAIISSCCKFEERLLGL